MRPLPALTSLRFFAALEVVLFHYCIVHPDFPHWLANIGYDAVTFFFVLSGFILTYAHGPIPSGADTSFQKFALTRLARIYPAYFLGLLCVLALYYLAGNAVLVGNSAWLLLSRFSPSREIERTFVHGRLGGAFSAGRGKRNEHCAL